MERRGNEGRTGVGDGVGSEDPARRAAGTDDPRAVGGDGRPGSEARRTLASRPSDLGREAASWVSWQSALYVFVLVLACVFLIPLTNLWWVVPVLGALVPLALAFAPAALGGASGGKRRLDKKGKERELLEILAERGEITPTTAAMRTSLTVDEASKMLEELARKGHLKLQTEDGIMAYTLPERNRNPATGVTLETSGARPEVDAATARQLDDPLSERELEVLTLLASGRTNSEISNDLYVALGTVKSHVNNIYRKLGAANRAEAVTRAQEMNLLR